MLSHLKKNYRHIVLLCQDSGVNDSVFIKRWRAGVSIKQAATSVMSQRELGKASQV